ncbi:hypothetical protein ACLOJK_026778 [Asimina triloba]
MLCLLLADKVGEDEIPSSICVGKGRDARGNDEDNDDTDRGGVNDFTKSLC